MQSTSSNASRLLDDETKWLIIIAIKYFKYKQCEVAEEFNLEKGTVSKIWAKYKGINSVDNQYSNCGRRFRHSPERVSEAIKNAIQKNRTINSTGLKRKLFEDDGLRYKSPTIRKKRKLLGYVGRTPLARPKLSELTIEKRLTYCKEHQNDKFTTTLFIDEAVVQLNENRTLAWYKAGSEDRPVIQQSNPNVKLMIAGGICLRGKTSLKIWNISRQKDPEKVNGEQYRRFLITAVKEAQTLMSRSVFRLQHDNARPHVCEKVRNYLRNKSIIVVPQPPYSPDLQPIEKVWSWIKLYIEKKQPHNFTTLRDATLEAWSKVPKDLIEGVIQHHIDKLPLVIEENGCYVE